MISIAIVGPDGAGKTTVSKQLAELLPVPVKYVYMGVNPDASNVMLPTTRLLLRLKRGRSAAPSAGERGAVTVGGKRRKGLLGRLKTNLRLLNRIGEEWFRQILAWRYRRSGAVVLFDRHFIADYVVDRDRHAADAPVLMARLRRVLLERVYPQPDLVVYLDAPADVLFARKGEGTIEDLERRRQEYLGLSQRSRNFVVVDARQPEGAVSRQVADVVAAHYRAQTGRSIAVASSV